MSRNVPPRDAIARADVWVPVDATGDDFYALGERFGSQAGVLHERHEETGQPYLKEAGAGFFDPRALRWHHLQRETATGVQDNRLSVQVVNDYEGPYEDDRPGDAPFGQPEEFSALNRSCREVDLHGRVALPSSHRRIIDSEDQRFALALTCTSVPLGMAEAPDVAVDPEDAGPSGLPVGIVFRDRGLTTGSGITTTQPSVSIGSVTYFGQGAVDAAREALAQGGSLADAAAWASAARFNRPRPPLRDAPGQVGDTRERTTPPAPDTNPGGGGVALEDHPAGYVWSKAGVVGLLGTLVCPEGAAGHYFQGREGTPIGPLPWRHDAQVTMGKGLVGRIVFVRNDAAQVEESSGKPFKGELWADTSRANQDTELGLETVQWRPVIRVTADLPPSRPPPPEDPGHWLDWRKREEEEKKKKEEEKKRKEEEGKKDEEKGRNDPDDGAGGGDGGGTYVGVMPGGSFTPLPRKPEPGAGQGDLGPVSQPASQVRDYAGAGEPCPNTTAGVLLDGLPVFAPPPEDYEPGGLPRVPTGGGWIQYSGHPGLTHVAGGLVVGGAQTGVPLGLPSPWGGGISLGPPDAPVGGVPVGLPYPVGGGISLGPPGSPPSPVPLGLPDTGGEVGGFGFGPPDAPPAPIPLGLPETEGGVGGFDVHGPLGGDKGVPHGAAERAERDARAARARAGRAEQDKREQEKIERLKELEERTRDAGRTKTADRIKRARERQEKRQSERREREAKKEEARNKRREERERRRTEREERRKAENAKRKAELERIRRQRRDRPPRRPAGPPEGGYMIDVTEGELATPRGLPDDGRRLLEEDRERERRSRESTFGHWNVANRPLSFFGAVGGPRTLEGWAHLATYSVQALQRVVNGAFGGPSYLRANVGVVHTNGPGNPPAGSRIGGSWSVLPGETVLDAPDEPVFEVVSTLRARSGTAVRATGGAVLRVARVHRGLGQIDDDRPLVLLDDEEGRTEADLIRDTSGGFRVDQDRGVTSTRLTVKVPCDRRGPALEVRRECEGASETFLAIDGSGQLDAYKGAVVHERLTLAPGGVLDLALPGGGTSARVSLTEAGLVLSLGSGERERRLVLGPKGVEVSGDLLVSGKVHQG